MYSISTQYDPYYFGHVMTKQHLPKPWNFLARGFQENTVDCCHHFILTQHFIFYTVTADTGSAIFIGPSKGLRRPKLLRVVALKPVMAVLILSLGIMECTSSARRWANQLKRKRIKSILRRTVEWTFYLPNFQYKMEIVKRVVLRRTKFAR